jgi:hypothetical protein
VIVTQFASILGAALILAAYGAHQAGRLGRDRLLYHLLNAAGGLILCLVAIDARQIGFIILEAVWTAISMVAMGKFLRGPSGA